MPRVPDLKVEVRLAESAPNTSVVTVKGFVDTSTWKQLDGVLAQLVSGDTLYAILDLSATEYISSIGWGLMVAHSRPLTDKGGALVLAGLSPELDYVFKSMGFADLLAAFSDADAAVTSRAQPLAEQG